MKMAVAAQMRDHGASFVAGKDDRKLGWPAHSLDPGDEVELPLEDLLKEK